MSFGTHLTLAKEKGDYRMWKEHWVACSLSGCVREDQAEQPHLTVCYGETNNTAEITELYLQDLDFDILNRKL